MKRAVNQEFSTEFHKYEEMKMNKAKGVAPKPKETKELKKAVAKELEKKDEDLDKLIAKNLEEEETQSETTQSNKRRTSNNTKSS